MLLNGGRECEAAAQVGEGLTRDVCWEFPIILILYIYTKQNPTQDDILKDKNTRRDFHSIHHKERLLSMGKVERVYETKL